MDYSGIYDDDGNLIGFVGGGSFIDELQNAVYNMSLNGMDNAQVYLLSSARNNYIFAPDSEMLGADITDPAHAQAITEAVANGSGYFSAKSETGQKMWVAYENIPDYDAVLMITLPESDVMGTINNLSIFMLILGLITLGVTLLVTFLVTKAISKDIQKVSGIIKDIGTLDLTNAKRLEEFHGRKDEVGEIADAAAALTHAVEESVRSLRMRSENLHNGAKQLSENSKATLESIGQVDAAVQEIAHGATAQSSETQNANDSVREIGDMVSATKEQTERLKVSSEAMRKSSYEAREILVKLGEVNEQTKNAVDAMYEQTSASTSMVNSMMEEVSGIASKISGIAVDVQNDVDVFVVPDDEDGHSGKL